MTQHRYVELLLARIYRPFFPFPFLRLPLFSSPRSLLFVAGIPLSLSRVFHATAFPLLNSRLDIRPATAATTPEDGEQPDGYRGNFHLHDDDFRESIE